MTYSSAFQETAEKHLPLLDQYVPIVDRVHGPTHPEFHDVKKVYTDLSAKIKADASDLSDDFSQLRTITSDYAVPGDACESYEAVYHMLADLDRSYHA